MLDWWLVGVYEEKKRREGRGKAKAGTGLAERARELARNVEISKSAYMKSNLL